MKIAQYHDNSMIRLGLIKSDAIIPLDFDGNMIEFAGRAVTQNEEGKNIFVDDRSSVDDYITAKRAERLKALKEGRIRPWQ